MIFEKTKIFFTILILIFISSCATYKMPESNIVNNNQISGTYKGDYSTSIGEYNATIYLYPDGFFTNLIFDYQENYSEQRFGTYFLDEETRSVDFYYYADDSDDNFTVVFDSSYNSFSNNSETYTKINPNEYIAEKYKPSDILNMFKLVYEWDDEIVIIEMYIYANKTFKERSIYPESEDMWTEKGTYEYWPESGVISFKYNDWPEGDYIGFFNKQDGVLYSEEGDYSIMMNIFDPQSDN